MASPLTERTTPAELADRQQLIETKEEIVSFPRLAEIIEADLATVPGRDSVAKWRQLPVKIRLRFGWADPQHERASLRGDVLAQVAGICQRCLEPFEFAVETELNLQLLPPGRSSDTDAETWELDEEWFRPADIVEEAVIMAMPMAAKHENETDCRPVASDAPPERCDMVRPFAGLKSQSQNFK